MSPADTPLADCFIEVVSCKESGSEDLSDRYRGIYAAFFSHDAQTIHPTQQAHLALKALDTLIPSDVLEQCRVAVKTPEGEVLKPCPLAFARTLPGCTTLVRIGDVPDDAPSSSRTYRM